MPNIFIDNFNDTIQFGYSHYDAYRSSKCIAATLMQKHILNNEINQAKNVAKLLTEFEEYYETH